MLPAGSAGSWPFDGTVGTDESLIGNDSAAGSQNSGAGWVNPEDHCQPVNSSGDGSLELSADQSVLANIVDLAQDNQSGEAAHYNSSSLSTPGDLPLDLDSVQLVSIQDADAIVGAGADSSTEQISGTVSTGLEIHYSALNQNDAIAPTSVGSSDSLGFFQDPAAVQNVESLSTEISATPLNVSETSQFAASDSAIAGTLVADASATQAPTVLASLAMTTPTNIESTNWSGAVITAGSGESFSTVSATWVVPTVSQVPITGVTISDVAEWVGIDGYNSSDVCQAGILETVQTSGSQTTISFSAWVEWYPASADIISASSFQVNPGDTIEVTVETTGAGATKATFILDDETTGQIYDTSLTAPSGTKLQGNCAEVVVETPELISGSQVSQPLLTDFLNSPVVFQGVSATYSNGLAASLSSAQSIGMWTDNVPGSNGSSVQEAYGSVQPGSVTVTEDDYWPAAAPTVTSPTVASVTESPNSGIAHAGTVVAITIDFSETVTVAGGTPTLPLNDGGTASYSSGSGTDALTFDYTVQSGQNTNNLLISSINLNGATVTDASGNNADFSNLTTFTPGNLEIYTTPTASVSASGFTVAPDQAITASSFFTVTNPNNDSITQYSFEDNGGGSGHFTVGGSAEPDGQAFTVSAANLSSVQYVGGSSAGTDTLTVDAYDATAAAWVPSVSLSAVSNVTAQTIQNEFFGITRGDLSSDQASVVANSINAGTETEAQYVNGLLSQVADTTIPAVAVEGSMYGVAGTSAEITFLATQFLPAQLGWATQHGFSPEVFACQVLGLAFAFGNENGATTFADNFGPSNAAMPNTNTGDAAFAAAVASAVFGSAANGGTATNRSRRGVGWNWGGVVSGVFNLESPGVETPGWRPRHERRYHAFNDCAA